ncbi:amidase [Actinocorallia populi]|uniref:amidase n=1 Tax=Actinocorallia populi TaxID=2079200 RepID=UPI000D08B8F9|nr:amidase [Actinocorallia populi]
MSTVHSFTDDALGDLDAVGLAERIRSGEASRAEVVEAAIARVERVDGRLNAVQAECFEKARRDVLHGRPGAFSGVPSFVKDNTDVVGLPTCHGSAAFDPRPAKRNGPPADQFLSQGFVLLGKSTLPEFGLTASTEYVDRPPTRNPWNTAYSAGASSGGAGALVASGAVPIAHGNDGGGSIRIPAAVNGLVGLKTTRCRLLDPPGARGLPVNLGSEGVLSRTVRDTARYLAAAEKFRPNRRLRPVGLVEGPAERRLRIGVVRYDVLGRPVHRETGAVLDSAVETLAALGHEVREVRLDLDARFVEDFKLYWALFAILLSVSYKAGHGRSFRPRDLDPFTKGLAGLVRRSPLEIVPAVRRLRGATALYDAHFTDVDVLMSPVLSHPAPLLGELAPDRPFEETFAKLVDYVGFTPINNVGGGPGISVPHGLFSNGMPGSVQLSAARGGERTLLELAYELEEACPFPRIHSS